jgi:hypothetical protein
VSCSIPCLLTIHPSKTLPSQLPSPLPASTLSISCVEFPAPPWSASPSALFPSTTLSGSSWPLNEHGALTLTDTAGVPHTLTPASRNPGEVGLPSPLIRGGLRGSETEQSLGVRDRIN